MSPSRIVYRAFPWVFVAGFGFGSAAGQTPLPAPASNGDVPQLSVANAARMQRRAEVSYQAGKLTVLAENSSLNQILQDIAAKTGMKIVGSVPEQRVFGTYGPGTASQVLSDLLDGSGANMMLLESSTNEPSQLVLTAAQGVTMPPVPMTPPEPQPFASEASPPQPVLVPAANPIPAPSKQTLAPPGPARAPYTDSRPAVLQPQSSQAGDNPPQASPATPQASPATPQSSPATPAQPGAPLTPQQIYQQLMDLRQKQNSTGK